MRVLLDTNIIIHREANKISNQDIGILFNWIDKLRYTKHIHPLTIEELNRNINKDAAGVMQIKLASYNTLKTEATLHEDVKTVSKAIDSAQNDFNDTRLLNEVYCNRVDVLISEDKKIHRKANILGIGDRVFRIDGFLEKLTAENPNLVDYRVLAVKKLYFGELDLSDSFFDSFREDYHGFDIWFNKKSDEIAYVCLNDGKLAAFLYLKVEDNNEVYADIIPSLSPKKRLKIGTFKVVTNGLKLGERFLKIVFDNARQYKVEEIYVTIFDKTPEQKRLISLLEDFGFSHFGIKQTKSGSEGVYIRDFKKFGSMEFPKKTFPWLSKESNIYIIPIKPEYHTELLPDSILNTEAKQDFIDNEPHRNAISKVYISHSKVRDLKSGDIIVFYRSGGIYAGVATTIGIVENIVDELKNIDELKILCRKRTVLNEKELEQYWNRYGNYKPFVINFLYAYSLVKRPNLKTMLDLGILPSMDSVRTINKLTLDAFKKLIIVSGI